MAEKSGRRSFPTHPLVAKLLGDRAEPGQEVVLAGYIGPSSSPDRVRLYLDLGLSRYVEIPADAIRDTWPTDPDDANSPTKVAVDGKADLDEVTVARKTTGARFLQGSIVDQYGAGAVPGGAMLPTTTVTLGIACTIECPTGHAIVCTSHPACPQQTWICAPQGEAVVTTPATVCTLSNACPPHNTMATVCTQVDCPPTRYGICAPEAVGVAQVPKTVGCLPPTPRCPTPGCPSLRWACGPPPPPPLSLRCPTLPWGGCLPPPTLGCPTPWLPCPAPEVMHTMVGCQTVGAGCPPPTVACGPTPYSAGCG